MDVSIEPLDEFVVIQPIADESETRAGLILPASATEAAPCRTGIVTAVGADANGIEAGDKVLYPRDAGYDVRLGGIEVKVLRREDLIARVWDENWFGSTKTLDVTVGRLRQKLEDSSAPVRIVAVRGVGFRLEAGAPDA